MMNAFIAWFLSFDPMVHGLLVAQLVILPLAALVTMIVRSAERIETVDDLKGIDARD